jgi:uncharacterized membrane protein YdjX (TVP38/TMEM64 family)
MTQDRRAGNEDLALSRSGMAWPLLGFAALLGLILLIGWTTDFTGALPHLRRFIGELGALAPAAYVAIYVAATLVGVPGTPFTLLAPFLFGTLNGFLVMVVASTASACLAFAIARYVAHDAVQGWLSRRAAWQRLSKLIDRNDWIAIPFVRIVPVLPFAVVNYGFGVTGVSFWRFALWSTLAMVPINAVLVLGAGALYDMALRGERPWGWLAAAGAAGLVILAGGLLGRRLVARS